MFRSDFPLFTTYPDIVYLDSASTTQKPQIVIDTLNTVMREKNANIHRGSYSLSEMMETLYEKSKEKVREYIGANSRYEIIYTYNATYAANLLARSLVKSNLLHKGDRILLSLLEHHANIVPWQIVAEEYGIEIDWISITSDGRIDYADFEKKVSGVRLISLTAASNVTGATTDFSRISRMRDSLHKKPILVVDASQSLSHIFIDVSRYNIDFLFATGHKVFADTGIGILYGRKDLLKSMNPAFCGGGAINTVSMHGYEPAGLPYRYEPGTPHIIGASSLLSALEYIDAIGGYKTIEQYEKDLIDYTLEKISNLPSHIRLIGPKENNNRIGVFSFAFDDYHPQDIADILADRGICVRAGHHCTDPLHTFLGLPATLRMSLSIYNTRSDIDRFIACIQELPIRSSQARI